MRAKYQSLAMAYPRSKHVDYRALSQKGIPTGLSLVDISLDVKSLVVH